MWPNQSGAKAKIDWGHKNILNLARQYSKGFVKVLKCKPHTQTDRQNNEI
jgi:hypothetical protein